MDLRARQRPEKRRGPQSALQTADQGARLRNHARPALPKGAYMDAIVRKATELGAAKIAPLESERTQVHLDADRSDKKIEKWQTAALEAAKQCGNAFVPEVLPVQKAAAFIESARG